MFSKPLQFNKPRIFQLNLHLGEKLKLESQAPIQQANLDTSNLNNSFSALSQSMAKSDSDPKNNKVEKKKKNNKKKRKSPFPTNFIRTTKYSPISFLPKSLMTQFYRYANIYFLIIAVLQCFPDISPLHPFSAITPLVFVLSLSLLRDGYEDYTR